jgi:Carbohydrate esterase, sialic acid-specific acetylesterase
MNLRLVLFVFFLFVGPLAAQHAPLPPKENFHLFLLAGQSNMAGRGAVETGDKTPHPRILMLNKEGAWVPAFDPMHFDKPAAGVGLGKTFATQLAEANPGITIGLIPCAVGGSPIEAWKPGVFYPPTKSYPWDDAAARTKLAMQAGSLKGVLWHQGESDAHDKQAPLYGAALLDLIARMRAEFESPNLPFIAGQLGRFEDVPWVEATRVVDQALRTLPDKVPHTGFVSSEGFKHKGDKVHFDSASLREFGKRYAEAYQRLSAGK